MTSQRLCLATADTNWGQWIVLPALPNEMAGVDLTLQIQVVPIADMEVEFGVMWDATDTATFTPQQTVVVNSYTPTTVQIWMACGGTLGNHIAMRCRSMTGVLTYVYIPSLQVNAAASCPQPSGFELTEHDSTHVTLQWDALSSTRWEVRLGGDMPIYTDTNIIEFDNLLPNTNYHVELRALCAEGDTTAPSVTDFVTQCGLFELPFEADFNQEHIGDLPNCWSQYSNNCSLLQYISTSTNIYASMHIGTDSSYAMLVGPAIYTRGDRIHVEFDVQAPFLGILEAGVLIKEDDSTRYIPVQTFTTISYEQSSDMNWYRRDFYTDTLTNLSADIPVHIAFRWYANMTHAYINIDNIMAESVGNCHAPTAPKIDTAYGTTVVLSWEDYSAEPASYEVMIYYLDDPETSMEIFYTESTTMTLYELMPMQIYDFNVRSLCLHDTTRWIEIGKVETSCDNIRPPYHQSFDHRVMNDTMPCWTSIDGYSQWICYNDALTTNQTSLTDTAIVATPLIEAPADELYVRFNYSSAIDSPLEVGYLEGDDTVFHLIDTLQRGTSGVHEFYTNNLTTDGMIRLAFRDINNIYNHTYHVLIDDLYILRFNGCFHPTAIETSEIGPYDVTLHITDTNNAGKYHIYMEHNGIAESEFLFDTVGTLTLLEPGTHYTINVAAECSDGVESFAFAQTDFNTRCVTIDRTNLPYECNFESMQISADPEVPCWIFNNVTSRHIAATHDGNILEMASGQQLPAIVALPEINSLRELFIEFDMAIATSGATIEIGVMDDPHERVTFSPIATLSDDIANRWRHYQVPIENYNGQGHFVALRFYNTSVMLDNVSINSIPDCSRNIDSLTIGNVWSNCADLRWKADIGHNIGSYYIIHVEDGDGTPSGLFFAEGSPYTICNLDELSSYNVWVELYCGSDVQAVSDTMHFTTMCDNMQSTEISYNTLGRTIYTLNTLPVTTQQIYSASQQLFTSDDFHNMESDMTGIEIDYYGINPSLDIKFCTIYVCQTSVTDVADNHNLGTMVYSGPLHLVPGWNTILFNQSIHHDADSNMVLTFVSETTPSGSIDLFRGYSNGAGSSQIYLSDTAPYSQGMEMTASNMRYDVRFYICPSEVVECIMPVITSLTSTDSSITVHYNNNEPCEVQITSNQYWTSNEAGIVAVGGTYTFNGLDPNTHYIVGVRRSCGADYSPWHVDHIATSIPGCPQPSQPILTSISTHSATIQLPPHSDASRWQVHLFNYIIDTFFTTAYETLNLSGLISSMDYHICLRRLCDYNNRSPWSDTLTFYTPHCSSITSASVAPSGSSAVYISWTIDDSDNATTPDSYSILYGPHGFLRNEIIDTLFTSAENITVYGLDFENMSYDFLVSSHCADGTTSGWILAGTYPPYNDNTGINSATNAETLTITPNPASEAVNITADSPVSIDLLDCCGRQLYHSAKPSVSHHIVLTDLPRGTYFVRATSNQGTIVRKMVKL